MGELSEPYLTRLEEPVAAAFERAAIAYSDSVAIDTGTDALTYAALNRAANRLAHALLARCGWSEQPIAFIDGGGAAPYVCLLAVLKTGRPYIALDPSQPLAQLSLACADVEPALWLAPSRHTALATQLSGDARRSLVVDSLDDDLSEHNPALAIAQECPAAIFFTTGTTGAPKGVYYDQRSLLHRIFTTILCTDIRPGDRQALYVLCDRTWSVSIVLSTLLSGATLCPFDIKAMGVPQMAEWVARERITHFSLTCSLYRQWLDDLPGADRARYPSLRFVNVGAEALLRRDAELFKLHFPPQCTLFHSFAMSECGRIAHTTIRHETPLGGERIAVGHADLDKEILICNDDGARRAAGESGEIVVRSRYMMSGYWRKPQLTAASMRPDPQGSDKRLFFTGDIGRIGRDGQLEVLGRRDSQVKVRGYRVQPSEVEQRLLDVGTISEAVVVALDGTDGDKRLVAYVVTQSEAQPSVGDLRAALAGILPDYAIPSAFVFLPALPLTPMGKVDRRALPKPSQGRPRLASGYVGPSSDLEARLVRVWEEVLTVAPVGVDDNFFELGGDSLNASKIIALVVREFETTLSPFELYECGSVGAMAAAIAEKQSLPADFSIKQAPRSPRRL